MKDFILLFLLIVFNSFCIAQDYDYSSNPLVLDNKIDLDKSYLAEKEPLKKLQPDWLGYLLVVQRNCIVKETEIKKVIEEVLVDAGIKPLVIKADDKKKPVIFLFLHLKCMPYDELVARYTLTLNFAWWTNRELGYHVKVGDRYDSYGTGDIDSTLSRIKQRTQKAITDYIKVNSIK